MSQTTTAPAQLSNRARQLDQYLLDQMNKTRAQVRLIDLFTAIMTLLACLTGALFLVALIDGWLIELSSWMRWTVLIALLAGGLVHTLLVIVPLVIRRINPVYAAKVVESARPEIKNGLINYLLLRGQGQAAPQRVVELVGTRAANDISGIEVANTVDKSRTIRIALLLTLVVAGLGLYKVFSPKDPFQTFVRILAPAADVARPARVVISNVRPGDTTAWFGQPLQISANIDGQFDHESVEVVWSTVDGQIVDKRVAMSRSADLRTFTANLGTDERGVGHSLTYRIVAGDGRSSEYRVDLKSTPMLSVDTITYRPPSYTGLPERRETGTSEIRDLEGTTVHIEAVSNTPLESAELELLSRRGDGQFASEATVAMEKIDEFHAQCKFRLQLGPNRQDPRFTHYRLNMVTADHQRSIPPNTSTIRVIPDLAPVIQVLRPDVQELDVPVNSRIQFDLRAHDSDFELSKLEVVVDTNGIKPLRQTLEFPPEADLAGVISTRFEFWPKKLRLRAGETVLVAFAAYDNRHAALSDRPDPNVTLTPNFVVRITEPAANPPAENNSGQAQTPDEQQPGDDAKDGDDPTGQPESGDQQEKGADDESESPDEQGNSGEPKNSGEQKDSNADESSSPNPSEQENSNAPGDQQSTGEEGSATDAAETPSSEPSEQSSGEQGTGDESESGEGETSDQRDAATGDANQPGDSTSGSGNRSAESGDSQASGGESGGQPSGTEGIEGSGNSGSSPSEESTGDNPADQGESIGDNPHDGQIIEAINNFQQQQPEQGDSPSGDSPQPSDAQSATNPSSGDSGENSGADSKSGQPDQEGTGDESTGNSGQPSDDGKSSTGNEASQQMGAGDQPPQGSDAEPSGQPGQDTDMKGQPGGDNTGKASSGEKGASDASESSGGNSGESEPGSSSSGEQSGGGNSGDKESENQPSENKRGGGDGSTEQEQPSSNSQSGGGGEEDKPKPATGGEEGGGGQEGESPGGADGGDASSDGNAKSPGGQQSGTAESEGGNSTSGDPKRNDGSRTGEPSSQNQPGGEGQGSEKSGGESSNTGQPGDSKTGNDPGQGNSSAESGAGNGETTSGEKGNSEGGGGNSSENRHSASGSPQGTPGAGSTGGSSGQEGAGNRGDNKDDPGSTSSGAGSTADAANLEYTRKATDLALDYLAQQETNPDPELLKRLNWSEEELREFLRRWRELQQAADSGDEAARAEYERKLESLGISPRDAAVEQSRVRDDNGGGYTEEGRVINAPPGYREWQKRRARRGDAPRR